MKPTPHEVATRKRKARQQLARLPFDEKLAALVRMQLLAREMAEARGRPFKGTVWDISLNT